MSVLSSVEVALEGLTVDEWKRSLVLSLAEAMDRQPNASIAKELRLIMDDLGVSPAEKAGDAADDLAAKRAARRSARAVGS